jgi:hypothetical protein
MRNVRLNEGSSDVSHDIKTEKVAINLWEPTVSSETPAAASWSQSFHG